MDAFDPRHGTRKGYAAGCREQCCRDATARYQRGRDYDKLRGLERTVPIVGAQRRVQALQRLGWSAEYMSKRLGKCRAWLQMMVKHNQSGRIYRRNHEAVAALYDELSMTLGPSRITRMRAEKAGYLPPLAWDDDRIDDPTYTPKLRQELHRSHNDVDEAVVLRILNGEVLPATVAEKGEVLRRWVARGGTLKDMCRRQGWKQGRYYVDREQQSEAS